MKKLWFLPLLVAIALAVVYYHQWQHWMSHGTGSYDTPGVAHHYNFFSGSGSDISELTIAFSLGTSTILLWRAHTCHAHWWCWRHGQWPIEGTPYKLCSKCHPDDVPTVDEAIKAVANGH